MAAGICGCRKYFEMKLPFGRKAAAVRWPVRVPERLSRLRDIGAPGVLVSRLWPRDHLGGAR